MSVLGSKRPLRIALISDELTRASLRFEGHVFNITPWNYKLILRFARPDLLFVESAWSGYCNSWRYRIAAYPAHPDRSNNALAKVLAYARRLHVPALFWNKEDGVHFDRFIDSARLFDHVFTVDQNCIPRYRDRLPAHVTVDCMMFAVQPATHRFTGFAFRHHGANFVGSYGWHVHERRRAWQDSLFRAACESSLDVTVFDRNSARKSQVYRFPEMPGCNVRPAISHAETASVYRNYLVSLNVNTVEDSATMFSRRLVEIIACGGIAVTNRTPATDALFQEYCYAIDSAPQAEELFERLRHGPSTEDLERARAGADYVLGRHTWRHRLNDVLNVLGIG